MIKYLTTTFFLVTITFTSIAQIKAECISGNCVTGRGVYKYSNGAVYDGEFSDSLKNGTGVMVWQNGDKYMGDWKAGYRTGKGNYYFADGGSYTGDFFKGGFDGKGTRIYKDSSHYIGDWKADKRNGKGKLIYKGNYDYEGDWVNDYFDGKGTIEWIEGSEYKGNKYIGDFKNGQRNGKGKFIYANGKIEEGEFKNDLFKDPMDEPWACVSGNCYKGFGTKNYEYGSKASYTGQFKNGEYNGEGTLRDFDNIYKGQFKDGSKNGFGTYTRKDGATFTGKWENDYFIEGTFNDGKGTSFTGQLEKNNIQFTSSISSISGKIKDYFYSFIEYTGEGAETSAEFMGKITKGQWEKGKLIGKGVEIYPNGYYMEAMFKDYSYSDEKYFNNQNIQITSKEFKTKAIYQHCANGNCYNGIGICEVNFKENIFVGNWVNGKKEGFVATFTSANSYYYGIWKADTLVRRIDDKEAEKYLTANAKAFLNLLSSNKMLAAAASLIENCTTETCISGDCKNGFGSWQNCKGKMYTGNFANGKYNGKGKLTLENGDVYDGNWVNGVKQGSGKYTWNNGNIYEGNWDNDAQQGLGKYTWFNGGDSYHGDWVNSKQQGIGKYTWSNGDVYYGDWVNNRRQGKGEMKWQNKEYYIGEWVNDIRHGKGRSNDSKGRIRDGDWINGTFVITDAQRQINEDAKSKISVLEKTIMETRIKMGNMIGPSDPVEKAKYEKVRENLKEGINAALKLIEELEQQIIE